MAETATPTTYTIDYADAEGLPQTISVTGEEVMAVVLRALVDAGVTAASVTAAV